jgi:hypothetical protein
MFENSACETSSKHPQIGKDLIEALAIILPRFYAIILKINNSQVNLPHLLWLYLLGVTQLESFLGVLAG